MSSRLAVMAVVLAASLPLPLQAYDIYLELKDEKGRNCCDSSDCKPAHYRHTPRGVKMFVDGRWIEVPNRAIQYPALLGDTGETAGGHWCGAVYEIDGANIDAAYVTQCAILPPQSASAQ
jgi:hypothetical protein